MGFLRQCVGILILLSLFAACTRDEGGHPKDPSKDVSAQEAGGGGGMDGGGGGTTNTSNVMQVEDAIKMAFQLASDTDWTRNVFVRFWLDEALQPGKFPHLGHTLFPDLKLPEPFLVSRESTMEAHKVREAYLQNLIEKDSASFESPAIRALSRPPKLIETGDCMPGEHADASVSSFNVGATICMSLGNLTKVAPSALLQEVLSLLLHEVAHMGGAKEEEARIWQARFSEYFNKRFNRYNSESFFEQTSYSLTEIQVLAGAAYELQKTHPGDPKIYLWMGQLMEHLVSLPLRLDPLALKLVMGSYIYRPDQANDYVNSAIALTQMMNRNFHFGSHYGAYDPLKDGRKLDLEPFPDRDPRVMESALREIYELAKIVFVNWAGFGGATDQHATCVLPTEPVLEEDLFLGFQEFHFWMIKPQLPPRVCNPGPKSGTR